MSRKVKLGRDRSSQHCSRVGQQGKGEPQKTQAGLKISNCRIRRIFFFFATVLNSIKGAKSGDKNDVAGLRFPNQAAAPTVARNY